MPRLRDSLVIASLLAGVEAYLILVFAPQLRPTGGLGRLGFRVFLVNMTLLFTWRCLIYPFFFSPLRHVPGPKGGNLFIGHGPVVFSKPPGAKFLTWVDSIPNDGLLRFRSFFNQEVLVPTTHETLKAVLSDCTYDYEKPSQITVILRRILGDGLILVEGAVHKFQRKHLLPSFQVKHIRELYPMFWAKACEMVQLLPTHGDEEVKQGQEFELEFGEYCARVTLDIIGIAGFGRDFGALKNPEDELVKQYAEVLEPSNEKLTWFAMSVVLGQRLVGLLPWKINKDLSAIQANLHSFALNMVKERRKLFAADKTTAESKNDILSLLVRSNDFDDHQLAEQVLTMMAAGHETTSSALSWCAYLLSMHPDVQRRVREEVRAALPSATTGEPIAAADIDALPLLNAVCLEVVRLYPTVPQTSRIAINDTRIGEHFVPKDTQITLVPWAINRSKHFWGDDANEFRPERWINADGTNNKTGGSSSNYAQLTFLHGPRSCIGQGFAQSELKCLLAAFVGRYEFSLARAGDEYFPAGLVTTKPVGGMWLKLKALDGW